MSKKSMFGYHRRRINLLKVLLHGTLARTILLLGAMLIIPNYLTRTIEIKIRRLGWDTLFSVKYSQISKKFQM